MEDDIVDFWERSSAVAERRLIRVTLIERSADHRAMLGEELSGLGFYVRSLQDEQVLLDSPEQLRDGEVIVLGPSLTIATEVSLLARLNATGRQVAMISLTDLSRMVTGRDWPEKSHDAATMDELIRSLMRLIEAFGFLRDVTSGNLIRGKLVLRRDGTAWWNEEKVPLTPGEFAIVHLLARNFRGSSPMTRFMPRATPRLM
jgi:DNA-binding response OmpR family regulator